MKDTAISTNTLLEIIEQYDTPIYVYNKRKIIRQFERLTEAFQGQNVRFFYAAKALTNINIIKLIHGLGGSIDCSSINEVKVAKRAGVPASQILYTSNSVHFSEIEEAVSEGVSINIDSLSNLEKFGKKFGSTYPVGIRLRPNVMGGGNIKIATGHSKSKFGIPIDQMDEITSIVTSHKIDVQTIHIHTGSGISDVEIFMKSANILLDATKNFPNIRFLDFGGGFKVPYKDDEKGVDIRLLADRISKRVKREEQEQGKEFQIWFEPGKFLVSEAGYLLSRVNVIEQTATITFAGIDTGFNHLIRPMFYDAYHRIENLTHPDGTKKVYTIVGNLCETDTFASDREVSEIREGDVLLIHNAGAYGFEMASSFNSRCRPAEILVDGDHIELIRRRESLEDLLHNQVIY